MKVIKTGEDFTKPIITGVNTVVNLAKKTLGGKGKSVMIDVKGGGILNTKDGVTVIFNTEEKDPSEQMGVKLVQEASVKQDRDCGDGTTSVSIVLQSLLQASIKNITAGADRLSIKKGLIHARDLVIQEIENFSTPVTRDSEQLHQVARVSAHGDEEVAKLVSDAFKQTNKHSSIEVRESNTNESYVDIISGIKVNSGWLSPEFINNPAKETSQLENPFVLVYEGKINAVKEIHEILLATSKLGRPLVIVSDSMDGDTLSTLAINVKKNQLSLVAINPSGGHNRKAIRDKMQDLAIATGATLLSPDLGHDLTKITLEDLGSANLVVVDSKKSVFYEGNADEEELDTRITNLEQQLKDAEEGLDKEVIKGRLAAITGGVGIIYVGGNVPTEVRERKDRVDDAKGSVESALESGVVPGGGTSLLFASDVLDTLYLNTNDENTGVAIMKEALEKPIRQILSNAELKPDIIISEIKNKKLGYGYNVITDEYVDLIDDGILDAAKVEIGVIQNATAVAIQFIETAGLITQTVDD